MRRGEISRHPRHSRDGREAVNGTYAIGMDPLPFTCHRKGFAALGRLRHRDRSPFLEEDEQQGEGGFDENELEHDDEDEPLFQVDAEGLGDGGEADRMM